MVPLKADVRKAEHLEEGELVNVWLKVRE
ncbi:MAG UNVERIFIED_CONTAM: DUF1905 domain-containing protein [Anaerolineae bacterium]